MHHLGGHRLRRADPYGVAAAVLAVVLLVVQWQVLSDALLSTERAMPLFLWQGMVATLAAAGAVAVHPRLRVALYVLGAVGATLYGLLSWAAAGAVDLLVALLLLIGVGSAVAQRLRS